MHPTKNDLPLKTRQKVVELLGRRLAEFIDLGLQAKQAHWNVKGPNFIALHELFDKVAGVAGELTDEVAERITALGGVADGTLAQVAAKTKLPTYSTKATSGAEHVAALSAALAALGKNVRADIDTTTEWGDAGTADLLTGASRELDKQLWFVEAHAQ